MSSRLLPILASAAVAASASSAFAFGAMVIAPTALRTQATHRAAVIEVIPANAVVNMARCYRGWCEAAYGGQTGYIHTPLLVSASSSVDVDPMGDFAPVTTVLTLPFTVVGGAFGATAPIVAGTR